MLAYFAISGLDVLKKLDKLPHSKHDLINWIYFHQITEIKHNSNAGVCGFRGSTSLVTETDVDLFSKIILNSKFKNLFFVC